ncbi:MAG TPA: hypothetical protein VN848_03395 [Gemmatimonadales bacterium]|nr:hypothetical protein [Gemmatimonadales bacterium]
MSALRVILTGLALGLAATAADAQQDSPASRATLVGLPGFYVAVEDMDSAAARVGVTAQVLEADVRDKLTTAGIRMYTEDDFKHVLEVPQYYVNVNMLALHGAQAGLFTYNVSAEVRQAIKLARDPSISSTSVTWRAPATVGTVGSDNFYVAIRDVVRDQTDLLLTALRMANENK